MKNEYVDIDRNVARKNILRHSVETKQDAYNISKWFFFHTWQDINNPRSGSGYMGIYFYDDGVSGANLTCLGEVYKAYSLNQSSTPPSVRGDSDGKTVFD